MKQNYSERQYAQMAKEQLEKLLEQIPFVSKLELDPEFTPRELGDFALHVHFSDSNSEIKLVVEVKSRGEKRFAVNSASRVISPYDDTYYVFAAPYISEQTAEYLRSKQLSFIDLSGNCYILTRRIIISVSGKPNAFIEHRPQKNYFSKSANAASTIMRTMLNNYKKTWLIKELSEVTGKSMGTVSNVKLFLMNHDWAEDRIIGFGLCNIREMLYAWSKDYQKKREHSYEFYSLDTVPNLEARISEWNRQHHIKAILGSSAAAARYAPVVRYNKLFIYLEQQGIEEFIQEFSLKAVSSGGNVTVIVPHDETPCLFTKDISGSLVTSPVQTIIDLLANAGRGEEAADAIINKEYDHDQR